MLSGSICRPDPQQGQGLRHSQLSLPLGYALIMGVHGMIDYPKDNTKITLMKMHSKPKETDQNPRKAF
jgi:hypothetical protein